MSDRCLEESDECRGPVELRWPGYGDQAWPRCEKHGNARLEREEGNVARNFVKAGFDEMDAGERWDEGDY